jgi:hypothetical protein
MFAISGLSKAIVAAVIIALGGLAIGLAYRHYTGLVDDKARLTADLAAERADREADRRTFQETQAQNLKTIAALQDEAKHNAQVLADYTIKMERITEQRDRAHAQLDKWRSTLEAETIKRPAVVARAARIAINHSMRRAYALTAPRGGEGDDTGSPNAAAAPAAPAGGPAGAGDRAGGDQPHGDAAVEPGSR